jgi:hypothetical protein
MLATARLCLRIPKTSLYAQAPPRHVRSSLATIGVRHKGSKRKKKLQPGEVRETAQEKRLRLRRKLDKELDKKRKKHEKLEAQLRARFRLPLYTARPDAVPFGSAIGLLRGWGAKQEIFVRSSAASWAGETKVVAMVRIVPNDHNPRGLKGRVKFPHPVVFGGTKGKKERIAVIAEGDGVEEAKKAGMIVGGKDYLEKVCRWIN